MAQHVRVDRKLKPSRLPEVAQHGIEVLSGHGGVSVTQEHMPCRWGCFPLQALQGALKIPQWIRRVHLLEDDEGESRNTDWQ